MNLSSAPVSLVRSFVRLSLAELQRFDQRIVWILGSPRSGSTWLLYLMAGHEAVVPINEPTIGWYLGPFLCDLPGGDASELTADNCMLRQVQREQAESFFAEQFAGVWVPALGRLLRERFYVHARRHVSSTPLRRRLIVVKEPNGSQSADVLLRALPRSRVLFLLRDGRDVVDSELAANLKGSWVPREFPGLGGIREEDRLDFVRQSAYKWLWRTQAVQNALTTHRGRSYILRYEELLAEPERQLRGVLEWLGQSTDESQLQGWVEHSAFARISRGVTGEREFFRSAMPGAWQTNLRKEEQAAMNAVIGPKLAELGYSATASAMSSSNK